MEISSDVAMWAITAAGGALAFFIFRLDRKFDKLEAKFEKIESRVDKLDTKIDHVQDGLLSHMHKMEERLSNQIRQFVDRVQEIEHDTVDMDRRLIVLETVHNEQRPRSENVRISNNPRRARRSARRGSNE